jgi:hypothetical protein
LSADVLGALHDIGVQETVHGRKSGHEGIAIAAEIGQ